MSYYEIAPHLEISARGIQGKNHLSISYQCPSDAGRTQIPNDLIQIWVRGIDVVVISVLLKVKKVLVLIDNHLVKCNFLPTNPSLKFCVLVGICIKLPNH